MNENNTVDAGDALVFDGGPIKALGEDRFGGYGIIFTTASDPDLFRDFFTKATDLDLEGRETVPVYWHHGKDPVLKDRKLSRATYRIDDAGVWFETKLQQRDSYEKAIAKLGYMGKLGYSTGTAEHLIRKRQVGKAFELQSWPIIELSFTNIPVEPRTSAMALKSLDSVTLDGVIDEVKQEEQIKSMVLQQLPALSKVMAPAFYLKGMNERSEEVEAALEECALHTDLLHGVLEAHVANAGKSVRARIDRDGRLPSESKRLQVEAMRDRVLRIIAKHKEVDETLSGIQKLWDISDVEQKAIDEQVQLELAEIYRLTGKKPEELKI